MSNQITKLSLKLKSTPVTLTNEAGTDENWEIREMVSAQRDLLMDNMNGRVELGPDGKVKAIKKMEGMYEDLLTRSMFRNGVAVKAEQVKGWPSTVTTALYRMAQEINGLTKSAEQEQEAAKNA